MAEKTITVELDRAVAENLIYGGGKEPDHRALTRALVAALEGKPEGITMRPASAARLALEVAVLRCLENGVKPGTIHRVVNEALAAQPSTDSQGEGR